MTPKIVLIIVLIIFIITYFLGKRALSIFPDIKTVKILFREKGVSGNSNKSLRTKIGAINNILDIVVTDHELWIRPQLSFLGLAVKKNDVLHKLNIK
ncbi:MAG: hypothetical protein GY756_12765 [bacterium]|nr:hypothetical protein [bacterium]